MNPVLKTLGRTGLLLATLMAVPAVAPAPWAQAWAQDVFPGQGLMEILPPGEVIGDGVTPVTVHFLALAPNGSGVVGLKPKATATEGTVAGFTEVGGGLYSMVYTPPKADAQKVVTLKLRGVAADKSKIEVDGNVLVFPSGARKITVTSNPPVVTLGQDGEAALTFVLEGPAGKGADLVLSASAGEIQNLTDMGNGRFSARFIPPRVNWPHLAIITAADKRDPGRVFGSVVVPLQGKTDYPVTARPNSSVILKIGGREFGPVPADGNGRAVVPVVVPPGTTSAQLTSVLAGQSMTENIDLKVPESKRIKLFPFQAGLPANGATKVPVRVLVRRADGSPDLTAQPNFVASSGTMSPARHEGEGVFVSDYTPGVGNSQMDAKIDVSLANSSLQTDSRTVTLVAARPEKLTLKSDPVTLTPAANSFRVFATVAGANGQGLGQRELILNAAGAKLKGQIQDLRGGDYRAEFTTTGSGPVEMLATVQTPPTGNPLRRVLLFPAREVITNDGLSSSLITILTVDEFGYPVPNVPVALKIERGDGNLPSTVTTSPNGLAQVYYTAGRKADLVKITVAAGDHIASQALLQVPGAMAPVDLPVSGSEDARTQAQKWAGIVTTLRIERQGATGAAAGPITAVETGTVTALQVKAEPSIVAPGGTVVLKIKAMDAEGRGVAGQSVDLLSSTGKFGAANDLGGGQYEIPLTVPMGSASEAKVSVSIGNASSFLRIPVQGGGGTASGWGTTGDAFSTPGTNPETPAETRPETPVVPVVPVVPTTPEKPPVEPKPKPAASAHKPWRVSAALVGSLYRYEQRPDTADGPLLPVVFSVGGTSGGAAATPLGFEVAFRGFLPSTKYIGFDADFRYTGYAVTADAFQGQAITDGLLDGKALLLLRYPFQAGDQEFHVGARVGGRYNDFMVLRGCLEGNGCKVTYQALPVPAIAVGAEIGADLGRVFGSAAIEEGLYGVTPVATVVDFDLGVRANEAVSVNAGFEGMYRRIDVVGGDTGETYGELSDAQLMLKVGVGYSF